MDARLALRTMEERVRSLAGRAETLRGAAEQERQARARAVARFERLRREAATAAAVAAAGAWLADRVEASLAAAASGADAGGGARGPRPTRRSSAARARVRSLALDFEALVDTAHRDEMARTEQRLRVEGLTEKAREELGLSAEALVSEFGPELGVPVLTADAETTADDDGERAAGRAVRAGGAAEAAARPRNGNSPSSVGSTRWPWRSSTHWRSGTGSCRSSSTT